MCRLSRHEWEVRPVAISVARRIVEAHHYARGTPNTGVAIHGLFRAGEVWDENCQGVAWWLPPTHVAAEATYPANWQGVLSLSRLVILPGVPANACSFLLARSRKLIDSVRWPCLVTYADEGQGHTGAIYRADNWAYVGLTKPTPIYVIGGRQTARKAGPRTRTHAEMLALGAEFRGKSQKHKYVYIRAT